MNPGLSYLPPARVKRPNSGSALGQRGGAAAKLAIEVTSRFEHTGTAPAAWGIVKSCGSDVASSASEGDSLTPSSE